MTQETTEGPQTPTRAVRQPAMLAGPAIAVIGMAHAEAAEMHAIPPAAARQVV